MFRRHALAHTARGGTRPILTTTKIKLKLSTKARIKLHKAMKHGKAKVVLSVRATDAAGNTTVASRKVTVKG